MASKSSGQGIVDSEQQNRSTPLTACPSSLATNHSPLATAPTARRRSLLAKAHLGQKQMGLDAAEWRVFLRDTTGHDSCRDLDDAALARLIETMAARGVRFTPSPRAAGRPSVIDSTSARAGQLGKIEALLTVQKLPWSYAHAIAKRMYKKDRVQLCGKDELTGIITALNKRKVVDSG